MFLNGKWHVQNENGHRLPRSQTYAQELSKSYYSLPTTFKGQFHKAYIFKTFIIKTAQHILLLRLWFKKMFCCPVVENSNTKFKKNSYLYLTTY
jgi:hypothetical protein